MKIYFSGSESSGKTTLARYTAKKYKLDFLPETARTVLAEQELDINNMRADIDMADKYQQLVFDRQIKEEQKLTSFVADRSLIDVVAYSLQYSTIGHSLYSSDELTTYIKALRNDGAIVFFVRPSKSTLHNDGVRETVCWEKAVSIDATMKTLFSLINIEYYQIHTDSAQERTQIINQVLSKLL